MNIISDLHTKAEEIACKYLRNQIRGRASTWLGIDGIPVAGSILAGFGWGLGLVVDILIPFAALSLLSATGIGIPFALILFVALFTATCD